MQVGLASRNVAPDSVLARLKALARCESRGACEVWDGKERRKPVGLWPGGCVGATALWSRLGQALAVLSLLQACQLFVLHIFGACSGAQGVAWTRSLVGHRRSLEAVLANLA